MAWEEQLRSLESSREAMADAERVGRLGRPGWAAEGLSGPHWSPSVVGDRNPGGTKYSDTTYG